MKKALKILAGLILALVLWDAWQIYFCVPDWEPDWNSTSPDGRFTVSIYYNPGIFSPLPLGIQPRGEVGTVVLRENRTGKVLQRERANYVDADTQTPGVDWFHDASGHVDSVGVISIGVWDLPPEEPGK
ncbi:MAG: hypothetical protein LBU76_07915 [Azoarcus sp.]|jgi:hypothetical protein|nr:hypothetical protein [Azoarcus sp.]